MKVILEIEDSELLIYANVLHSYSVLLQKNHNQNRLLEASVMQFSDILNNAIIDQIPPDRLDELMK